MFLRLLFLGVVLIAQSQGVAANTLDAVQLTVPTLSKDFHLECDLNPKLPLGFGAGGTLENWISFSGGMWNATWGNGTIELGGHDYQRVLPELAAKLDTRYLLKTSDASPAYIMIKTDGWRTGPREVLEALNDPVRADSVDPSTYKFRLFIGMTTGDSRYNHVNTSMWVASGMRKGAKVIYDAYLVG